MGDRERKLGHHASAPTSRIARGRHETLGFPTRTVLFSLFYYFHSCSECYQLFHRPSPLPRTQKITVRFTHALPQLSRGHGREEYFQSPSFFLYTLWKKQNSLKTNRHYWESSHGSWRQWSLIDVPHWCTLFTSCYFFSCFLKTGSSFFSSREEEEEEHCTIAWAVCASSVVGMYRFLLSPN